MGGEASQWGACGFLCVSWSADTLASILERYTEHRIWTLKLSVTVCLKLGHKLLGGITLTVRLFPKTGRDIHRTPGRGLGPWCLSSWDQLLALIVTVFGTSLAQRLFRKCWHSELRQFDKARIHTKVHVLHKSFPKRSTQPDCSYQTRCACGSNTHRTKPTQLCPGTRIQCSVAPVRDQITNATLRRGWKQGRQNDRVGANMEEKVRKDSGKGWPCHGARRMVGIKANCQAAERTRSYLGVCRGPSRESRVKPIW